MRLRFVYICFILLCLSGLYTAACSRVASVPNAAPESPGGPRISTAADSAALMKYIKQYNGEPEILQDIKQSIKNMEQKDPESPYIDIGKGIIALYSARKNYSEYKEAEVKESVKFFTKALQKDPTLFYAYIYGAYAYLYINNFMAAESFAKIAEDIKPGSPLLILLHAEMSLQDKDYEEAKNLAQKITDKETDSDLIVRAHLVLLRVYIDLKQYDPADASCDKLTALRPKSPWILMECSKFYESQKEFDKAVELAEKSIADNDNLSQETKGYVSELYAGQAYDMGNRQTKDWESRSLVALNNAIKYNPRNAMVYYHLAWLHLNLGRRTKDEKYLHQALGYLEKLHELMPSFTLADKLLENIRYELDNIQKSKQ